MTFVIATATASVARQAAGSNPDPLSRGLDSSSSRGLTAGPSSASGLLRRYTPRNDEEQIFATTS